MSSSSLEEKTKFDTCCTFLRVKGDQLALSDAQKLQFYGLYKQVTEGKCNTSCPSFWDLTGKAKWNAWNALGDLSSEKAKEELFDSFFSICPGGVNLDGEAEEMSEECKGRERAGGQGGMGPVFSRMVLDEEEGDQEDVTNNTVFTDIVRRGQVDELHSLIQKNPSIIDEKDDNGMTPLHTAADSEQLECVKLLVESGAPINLQDDSGQTPLYIAALCDFEEIALFLLEKGADPSIPDESGETPSQATTIGSLATRLNSK
eukprot:CAMPEP_0201515002 /NCGR_PEP_ID=MMETSP0161_2-20130828/6688_1 /ASSEMBLY_ACC=CAM_ASM_000251 /TAXON_ID=180227 /ORGANISM="Neoparamoeba aestuarina, Strain SoJaBio B1-5/56/2" /LENGTH=259 /DNA_ID=CAMNT_0047911703 /DNA_START=61 /DNA_END=841 /DNA_ORIENTATION=+